MTFITRHARKRWRERFGDSSMDEAILRAVPYGAQLGNSAYKLDTQTDAVFVVKRGVIKTVLTKEMAIVNQQSSVRGTRRFPFAGKASLDPISEQVKELASKHVSDAGVYIVGGSVRLYGSYKPRLKELREIVPLESKNYEKYLAVYYQTITAYGRAILNPKQ